MVIRTLARGPLELGAAVSADGQPCLLVRGRGPALAPTLERARRAHQAAKAAEVPAPLAWDLDGDEPWLALGCDPIGTLEELMERVPRRSVPYAEGIVVTRTIARVVAAGHAAPDGGWYLGALSPWQLVVDRDGSLRVFGLGLDEAAWDERALRAPSVAMGAPPTPASDVHMGLLFVRSLIHWVADFPPSIARLLRGEPGPLERAFSGVLVGVLGQSRRIDGGAALRGLERFWSFLGVTPDERGWRARARAALDDGVVSLEVERDYAWFSVAGGRRHDLLKREPMRRVFRALLEAGGASLSVDDLVKAAWPGEALIGSSGPDRLYVAVSSLRKLDLRDALVRDASGYSLRARARFVAPPGEEAD